jgi:hypothetical protein
MIFLDSPRKRLFVFFLAATALAIRISYIYRHYDPLVGDGRSYQACAEHFLQGKWLDHNFTCSGHPPGFAALLALEYAALGTHCAVGIACNLLITLAGIWMAGLLAKELAGEKAGWIALILSVVYYDSIRDGQILLADPAFNFLLAAGTLFLLRSREDQDWAAGTILLGLSSWFRAITEPLILWLPAWIFFREGCGIRSLKKSAFCFLLFLLSLSPAIIRNSLTHHHLVGVATDGGITFWPSNYAGSKGDWNLAGVPTQDPRFLALPEWQRDQAYYREGFKSLAQQPLSRIMKREVFKIFGMLYPFLPEYDYSFVFCLPFFLLALLRPLFSKHQEKTSWGPIYLMVLNSIFVTLLFNGYPHARTPLNWIILAVSGVGLEAAWNMAHCRLWIWVWGIFNLALWSTSEPLRLWLKAALKY